MDTKMGTVNFPYKEVFEAVEQGLVAYGAQSVPEADIRRRLDAFKDYSSRLKTDDDYYHVLVYVAFYSGFKAATVTARLDVLRRHFPSYATVAAYTEADIERIVADPAMIANERKIRGCVNNARQVGALVARFGSFRAYLDSFAPDASFENLLLLKESLEATFDYLGGITVYHFMTDIGLQVLKPDRVMCRIFHRLGLLEDEGQLLKAVLQGRKFAAATGHPIRYIDIVFVAYGQAQSEEFGITNGICLKRPRCVKCAVRRYCGFEAAQAA